MCLTPARSGLRSGAASERPGGRRQFELAVSGVEKAQFGPVRLRLAQDQFQPEKAAIKGNGPVEIANHHPDMFESPEH